MTDNRSHNNCESLRAQSFGGLNATDQVLQTLSSVQKSLDLLKEAQAEEFSSLKSILLHLGQHNDIRTKERKEDHSSYIRQELQLIRADLNQFVSTLVPINQYPASLTSSSGFIAPQSSKQQHEKILEVIHDTKIKKSGTQILCNDANPNQTQDVTLFSHPNTLFNQDNSTVLIYP